MTKIVSLIVLALTALAGAATQPGHPDGGPFAAHKPSGDGDGDGQSHRPNHSGPHDHDLPVHPAEGKYHALRARDPVPFGVYTCKGPGWQNSCSWARNNLGVCYQLPDSKTLAFGPDQGIQCRLFVGKNCNGQGTAGNTIRPGVVDWQNYQQLKGQVPRSYQCRRCGPGNLNCGANGVGASYRWDDLK